MSTACPDEDLLVAFAEGHAPAAEIAALHRHLDGCSTCRSLVAELAESELAETAPFSDAAHVESAETPVAGETLGGVPIQLDEYQLLRPLGSGAMGTVYLAHDTLLDREVAIKWIAMLEPDTDARRRFLLEARAIARLQHPNVASVYRVGQLDGRPYLVYEYVRGQSLDRLLRPVPRERLLKLAIGLARGLDAAHRRGVLHRDLKPANAIVTDDGEVKLLDFGLAKLLPRSAVPLRGLPGSAVAERPISGPDSPMLNESGAVGTPLYMAPEVWRGEAATPRADLYSLGALLYELASGQPPLSAASFDELRDKVQRQAIRPTLEVAPSLEARFAAVVDRCLCLDPEKRFASADELGQALALLPVAEQAPLPGGNPYRGLAAFESEHRALFYGRNSEIREVMELLQRESIVVVSGDSGVGKSSLCRAGVLPLCQEGGLKGGRTFTTCTLVPGPHPLSALAASLAASLETDAAAALEKLREPTALASELAGRMAGRAGLLLFIDPLEELVSTSDPDEAAAFTQSLRVLVSGAPGLRVLAAVRGDFLGRVASLPGLWELAQGLYLLRPLSTAGLREAIVNPARVRGVAFESEALVSDLVYETLHAEGGLPLLSFALAELWEAHSVEERLISASALYAIGGVSGALARHADTLLRRLSGSEQAAARRLLSKLVTVEGLRARRSEQDLCPPGSEASRVALEALLNGRLLVARTVEGSSVYELAHETLISEWGTLRTWLAESREARALQQRLDQAVSDWERLGQTTEALWGVRQLAEAELLRSALELSPREQAFLDASSRQLRNRQRLSYGLLFVAVLVASLLGGEYFRRGREERLSLNLQLGQARELLTRARSSRIRAEQTQDKAFAAFKHHQRDAGERLWTQVLAEFDAAEQEYGTAMQSLETALLLGPKHSAVRVLFASILAERVLLAERRNHPQKRDELLLRLGLYDSQGTAYRELTGPVPLFVTSRPAGAEVTMARYVRSADGRTSLSRPEGIGVTPLQKKAVEQGSYLLSIAAPGRVAVQYPVVVERSEAVRVYVELPSPAVVPNGMIYIPAGRFPYGSALDESTRRGLLNAEPLHAVNTASYLIARLETTFEDWLTYLRALPASERSRRLPHTTIEPLGASLMLTESKDGNFELTWQTPSELQRVRFGEPLRLKARDRRMVQDWRRFPVIGISIEDAQAYVAWLDKTKRIPQARLCTEYEWERAGRGADGREYPHGDLLFEEDANHGNTYGRVPGAVGLDEVGVHPASRSPFGLDDMSGNAAEWVSAVPSERCCTFRGGAYYLGPAANRISARNEAPPTSRGQGMRVCADPVLDKGPPN